jgi:hypothetical protein
MNAPGKIVIVSQYYAPDPSTTATYMTAIADGLNTDGEVLVISGTTRVAPAAAPRTAQPRIVEIASRTPEKAALICRMIAMVVFSIKIFLSTLTYVNKDDVVLCVTTPFTLPYAGHVGDKAAQGVRDSADLRSVSRSIGHGKIGAARIFGGEIDPLCQRLCCSARLMLS